MAKKGQRFATCGRCGKAIGYANHGKCALAAMPEVPEKPHLRRLWLYWYCGAEKTLPSLLAEKFGLTFVGVNPNDPLKRQCWDIQQWQIDRLLEHLPRRYEPQQAA